ncbi:hypothetical protein [Levilactobacillus cerevisiae]|nr:hypothetical protein [Levilactobacillus cerevisiae]
MRFKASLKTVLRLQTAAHSVPVPFFTIPEAEFNTGQAVGVLLAAFLAG